MVSCYRGNTIHAPLPHKFFHGNHSGKVANMFTYWLCGHGADSRGRIEKNKMLTSTPDWPSLNRIPKERSWKSVSGVQVCKIMTKRVQICLLKMYTSTICLVTPRVLEMALHIFLKPTCTQDLLLTLSKKTASNSQLINQGRASTSLQLYCIIYQLDHLLLPIFSSLREVWPELSKVTVLPKACSCMSGAP